MTTIAPAPARTARAMMCPPPAVAPEATALWAWSLLQAVKAERVLVMDNGRCLGVVEVHDLWMAWALDLTGAGGSVADLITAAALARARTGGGA